MDYFKILNLIKEPFSNSPDPDIFFQSSEHKGCFQKLEIALRLRRGLSVVVGEIGTGKTTLCRQFIRFFSKNYDIETHLILDPSYTNTAEFLLAFIHLIGIEKTKENLSEWESKELIKNYLFQKGEIEQKIVVLIVDEGQKLNASTIEILREFLNYETNEYKLLQIIIFAQKEFQHIFDNHANFTDRISFYHELKPLNFKETRSLIRYRIESASEGYSNNYFSFLALWVIYRLTEGYPRKIINLCHQCLLSMIVQNSTMVDLFLVRACGKRLPFKKNKKRQNISYFFLLIIILFVSVFLLYKNINFINLNAPIEKPNKINLSKINKSIDTLDDKLDKSIINVINEIYCPGTFNFNEINKDNLNINSQKVFNNLGKIKVKFGDTIEKLTKDIYGIYNDKIFTSLLIANPNLKDKSKIFIGDEIIFPAIPLAENPLFKKTFWIEIDRKNNLEEALEKFRLYIKEMTYVKLIPFWNKNEGLNFSLVFKEYFFNKTDAQKKKNELSFLSNKKILSLWNEDSFYFTNPFYRQETIKTVLLKESKN